MAPLSFRAWDPTEKRMGRDITIVLLETVDGTLNGALAELQSRGLVVMQSTGLTDKNGKEIFAGDIVDHRYGRSVVKWDDDKSGFYPFNGDINCPHAQSESEVIGNAYENPDLLSKNDSEECSCGHCEKCTLRRGMTPDWADEGGFIHHAHKPFAP